MNNIHISIITLNKNDHLKFLKTLRSIEIQKINFGIEWIIVDGSDQKIYKKNQEIIRRKLLIKFNKKCAVTGIDEEEILLASHILPWKDADNFQRLDIENGILLNPFYDKLFDKFFISFSDNGKIVLSEKLKTSKKLMQFIDIEASINITEGMKKYLRVHRKNLKN